VMAVYKETAVHQPSTISQSLRCGLTGILISALDALAIQAVKRGLKVALCSGSALKKIHSSLSSCRTQSLKEKGSWVSQGTYPFSVHHVRFIVARSSSLSNHNLYRYSHKSLGSLKLVLFFFCIRFLFFFISFLFKIIISFYRVFFLPFTYNVRYK
jgi:hypothetical protein